MVRLGSLLFRAHARPQFADALLVSPFRKSIGVVVVVGRFAFSGFESFVRLAAQTFLRSLPVRRGTLLFPRNLSVLEEDRRRSSISIDHRAGDRDTMRTALILLLTAGLALAAPNRRRQDDGDGTVPAADDPSTTTTVSMGLPTVTDTIVFPTMTSVPSFNTSLPVTMPPLNTTSLPPNGTVTLPPITSSAELPSSSSSVYSRSSRSRRPHTEPIPIFTSKCACEGFSFPCWAYDALNRCVYEENFSLGCYFQNKGCPSPTRSCAQIYKPTPPTGKKHPCDLSPPEETISEPFTSTSMVITAVPTLPTLSTLSTTA